MLKFEPEAMETGESPSVKMIIQVQSWERRVKSCRSLAEVEWQSYNSHSTKFQALPCIVTALQSSNSQVTVKQQSADIHNVTIIITSRKQCIYT